MIFLTFLVLVVLKFDARVDQFRCRFDNALIHLYSESRDQNKTEASFVFYIVLLIIIQCALRNISSQLII